MKVDKVKTLIEELQNYAYASQYYNNKTMTVYTKDFIKICETWKELHKQHGKKKKVSR